VDALLRDLGASLRRGGDETPAAPCFPTGLAEIDRALGGGFPRGRVSEVVGPACCGRTSLALALLARVTAQGELAVVVDGPDVFDAASAASAGVDLERVLWVRPTGLGEALRSVEHVLQAGGFPLVLLDLAAEGTATPRIPTSAWPRLRKATAAAAAALVLLARRRLAGTFADLALELDAAAPRFESGPDWLAGLDGRVRLVRSRAGPHDGSVVRWRTGRNAA
jgi:RecA/RadA recombinase